MDDQLMKILDQLEEDKGKICNQYRTGMPKDVKKKIDKWKKSFFQIGDILAVLSKNGWKFYEGYDKARYIREYGNK